MLLTLLACGTVPLGGRRHADPDDTIPEVLATTPCDACGGDCLVEELAYGEAYHVEGGVTYASVPPAGGPHDPCWAAFGVHAEPVPDERWVHDLEHGAVVLLHDCDACDDDVAALDAFTAARPWALSTPYPGLGAPFALLAWELRATLGCWDEAFAEDFYDANHDRAPESVPSGPPASCPP